MSTAPRPPQSLLPDRHQRFAFLGWIALNCLGLNAVVYFLAEWIRQRSWLPDWLIDSNLYELGHFLRPRQGHDSWAPMLQALHFWQAHPGSSIYQGVFFTEHIKFQYPLTSLLPFAVLSRLGIGDARISTLLGGVGWASVAAVAVLSVAIARRSAAALDGPPRRLDAATIAAILLSSVLFYPLLKSCVIGQVQTELTLAFAAAFYCWLRSRERTAGALIGVIILFKPQFFLLLVWAALRKRWGAAISGMIVIALVLPIAVIVFGWQNNLEYLAVLRSLSRVGESFFQNYSMNGLLNRLLFNGGEQMFHQDSFPPYDPVVYAGTLVSSIFLIGLGLVFPVGRSPGGRARRGGMADFACMTAVATIASPIAWQHHYGVFLPIVVWLWFGRASGRAPVRGMAWLVAAYILLSDCMSPLNLLYQAPVLNVLQSSLYFGGLIVVWILLSPRYGFLPEGDQGSDIGSLQMAGSEGV
jgi:alpha-1,2-mannosyltransferase